MAIVAAGVRYDQNKVIQAVVVVTDDNGGNPNHLNPHILQAAQMGHGWINIPPAVYKNFQARADLEAFVASAINVAAVATATQ